MKKAVTGNVSPPFFIPSPLTALGTSTLSLSLHSQALSAPAILSSSCQLFVLLGDLYHPEWDRIRSPPFSSPTLPPLGPTPSEGLVPVTMVSPWCRARTRYSVILSWASKQQQVRVKTVTGVLGPAGFVVLEQHGRLPATPYHPLFYLPPPPHSMYPRILATMSTYHVFHA